MPFEKILNWVKQSGARRSTPLDNTADSNGDPWAVESRNLSQWFRGEPPPDSVRPVRPPLSVAPHQRVLVCGTAAGIPARARIEISSGRLAGTHIQITATNHGVAAHLLTGSEASRQTLMAAMDVVRERLRVRGVLLAATVGRGAPAQHGGDDRHGGRSGGLPESGDGSRE